MSDNTIPRTASEAIQQATRFERGKELLTQGYEFTKDRDFDVYAVKKPGAHTAADYWIVDGECDCPDRMKKGRPCKHEYALEILKAEETAELEGYEAQAAQYDDFHGPDMPPANTTRALMLAEYRRAERNLVANPEPFSTKAEASRQRMRDTEAALLAYDETTCKQTIGYYKRGLDKQPVYA